MVRTVYTDVHAPDRAKERTVTFILDDAAAKIRHERPAYPVSLLDGFLRECNSSAREAFPSSDEVNELGFWDIRPKGNDRLLSSL